MSRLALASAALLGLLGVALGAMGAHAWRPQFDAAALRAFDTAVFYHLIHTLALFGTGLLLKMQLGNFLLRASAAAFATGIVLFSGSLYLLAAGAPRWLGPVTPLGGVLLMLAWLLLLMAVLRRD